MTRDPIFSLTKKDFNVRWFSGTGPGGQHRNKSQNCCEITHIESGIKAQATGSRERSTNKRQAFQELARRLTPWIKKKVGIDDPVDGRQTEVIRNYHGVRNEVKDHASDLRMQYADVVDVGDLSAMIEARAATMAMRGESE